jgi:hypothetical protein
MLEVLIVNPVVIMV